MSYWPLAAVVGGDLSPEAPPSSSTVTITESSTRRAGGEDTFKELRLHTNSDFPIFHVPAFSIEVGDDLEDGERECSDERD